MYVRVFSFDCHAPTAGADLLVAQLRLAHLYYNDLIAVERARREAYRKRCDEQSDELRDVAMQIEACVGLKMDARAEAADGRMQARSRRGASDESREAVDLADEDLRRLWDERDRLIRSEKRRDKTFTTALEALDEKVHDDGLEASRNYARQGLFWVTRNAITQSIEQARKSHRPPHFRRGGGIEGQVHVEFRDGVPPVDLAENTQLQIDPVAEGTYDGSRGDRRRGSRTTARIRVGSNEERDPVWVEFPVVVHRPIPPTSRVLRARLCAERVASRMAYRLQITVESPEPRAVAVNDKNAIGIDIGWRWQDAVRVAYTVDAAGNHGPVSLANDVPGSIEHARSIQSIRSRNLDMARADLAEFVARRPTARPRSCGSRPSTRGWSSTTRGRRSGCARGAPSCRGSCAPRGGSRRRRWTRAAT